MKKAFAFAVLVSPFALMFAAVGVRDGWLVALLIFGVAIVLAVAVVWAVKVLVE